MKNGLIDFHSHIIPAADHGCDSVSTAIFQLDSAQQNGVTTVVATPHFYPHRHTVDSFIALRQNGFDRLAPHIPVGMQVIPGAEVQLCVGLDKMDGLSRLCIDGTNILLLEMPDMPIVEEMYETAVRLRARFDIIFAHVDRYSESVASRLQKDGFMLQLNADAICSLFTRRTAMSFVKSDSVYAIGSDIHGVSKNAYKRFAHAMSVLGRDGGIITSRMRRLLFGENIEN